MLGKLHGFHRFYSRFRHDDAHRVIRSASLSCRLPETREGRREKLIFVPPHPHPGREGKGIKFTKTRQERATTNQKKS